MFGAEKSLPMQPADRPNLYSAFIPATDLPGYGQMVRYWVTASSTTRRVDGAQPPAFARKPRREDDAYGAVVGAVPVRPSPLPVVTVTTT
jgi:hypothetical protein